jgi:multiple antibiotic resistance protein
MDLNKLLTVTFTLFAVIDIIGSIPVLISLKERLGISGRCALRWSQAFS